MKVRSNDVRIAPCAVHQDSATTSIRLVGMQIACASCWLSAKFVATHLVYSVLTNCTDYPRCVPLSYIHSCMPGNSADVYSGLDLLFSYACHNINAFDSGCATIDTVDAVTERTPRDSFHWQVSRRASGEAVSGQHQGKFCQQRAGAARHWQW